MALYLGSLTRSVLPLGGVRRVDGFVQSEANEGMESAENGVESVQHQRPPVHVALQTQTDPKKESDIDIRCFVNWMEEK